jgi:hypothetical protein
MYSGLRITGMAFYNQSELPAFFSPRQVNFEGIVIVRPQKMILDGWFHQILSLNLAN